MRDRGLTSQRVTEMAVQVCQDIGLPEAEAPARATIDDYRTGRYNPGATAILLLRHVTGGEIDVQHWVRDQLNRPDYVAPRRPGPPPGKMALGAEYVAAGLSQTDAAETAGCSRQAISQWISRHGLPEITDARRREIVDELVEAGALTRAKASKLGKAKESKPDATPVKRRGKSTDRQSGRA